MRREQEGTILIDAASRYAGAVMAGGNGRDEYGDFLHRYNSPSRTTASFHLPFSSGDMDFAVFNLAAATRLQDERENGPLRNLARELARDFGLSIVGVEFVRNLKDLYGLFGVTCLQELYDTINKERPLHSWLKRDDDPSKTHILQSPIKGHSLEFAVVPSLMKLLGRELVSQLNPGELNRVDAVVGLAESGISIANYAALAADRKMVATRTTAFDVPLQDRIILKEPGAAFEALYTSIPRGTRIWLVDDELTRGWTLVSFVEKFREMGVEVVAASSVFEVLEGNSDGKRHFQEKTGLPLHTLLRIKAPSI